MRSIHRKMSLAAFEHLPRRVGWKHEYYDGKAHITPAKILVSLLLDLAPRWQFRRAGIRPVTPNDAKALQAPFLKAFALSPEYAGHPRDLFMRSAAEYIDGFFGDVRGRWSPASVVAEVNGQIMGAALVKVGGEVPLLDCLFVSPEHSRQGWATALVNRVVNTLVAQGKTKLWSRVHLANEPSLAWHQRFGFQEVPDFWVAVHRYRCYEYELDRHRRLNDCPMAELTRLAERVAYWFAESERLEELIKRDIGAPHSHFD